MNAQQIAEARAAVAAGLRRGWIQPPDAAPLDVARLARDKMNRRGSFIAMDWDRKDRAERARNVLGV